MNRVAVALTIDEYAAKCEAKGYLQEADALEYLYRHVVAKIQEATEKEVESQLDTEKDHNVMLFDKSLKYKQQPQKPAKV